mmetsp:Transcript_23315/g.36072  ORF Transcript_23315/g.36072 Transcript_23315/m.36072 type:complete len:425 (+) Transcript_23315:884-2158(+)
MTLLHVWSILFPCITHGYTAVVVPGVWEWPASERTPVKCSVSDEPGCWPGDANPELKQMGLQVDDVFRMVEMTIFLCILLPISVRWFASKWHAGIHLHRLVNLVYFVDIVRRHSHPHSWILNTPVFALYLFDKHVFTYFYKRNKSPAMKRIRLGQDFMVLYWDSPYGFTDTVGPDYSMLMNNSSLLEQKHVFTCFENRSGRELEDTNEEEDGTDTYENESSGDGHKWTVGVVIRVFRRPRSPVLGARDRVSHTQRMYDEEPLMLVTGPRQGDMSEMVRLELLRDRDAKLVLLGAGSAINFILDGLQWCTVNKPARKKISLVYTTRDFDLFQWAMSAISNIVPVCEARGIFFDVKMAYTGSMTEDSSHNIESTMHSNDADYSMHGSMHGTMHGSMHESTYLTSSSEHGMNASTHSTRRSRVVASL